MNLRLPALAAGILLAARPAPADLSRLALLPGDSVVRIRVSNVGAFAEEMKKTSLLRLWNDGQMQAFLGRPDLKTWVVETLFAALPREAAEMMFEQYDLARDGESVAGFTTGGFMPYTLAGMSAETHARVRELGRRMETALGPDRSASREETFQGVPLRYFEYRQDGTTSSTWEAHVGTTYVSGPDRAWVERTIVTLLGQTPREPEGAPSASAEIDLRALLVWAAEQADRKTAQAMKEANLPDDGSFPTPPKAADIMNTLGILRLNRIAFQCAAETDHIALDTILSFDGPLSGVFTLFDPRPVPADLRVPFLPAHALSYSVGRTDLPRFWKELFVMIDAIQPAASEMLRAQLAAFAKTTGVDVEKDILDHLDTLIVSYGVSDDAGDLGQAMALRLRNDAALQSALDRMLNPEHDIGRGLEAAIRRETFRDRTLFVAAGGDEQDDAMAFAVAGGHLLFGNEDVIRAAIAAIDAPPPGGGFYATPRNAKLRALMPDNPVGYGVIDVSGVVNLLVRTLAASAPDAAAGPAPDPDNPFAGMDRSKLPSAGHIASFFGPAFTFTTWAGGEMRTRARMYHEPQ